MREAVALARLAWDWGGGGVEGGGARDQGGGGKGDRSDWMYTGDGVCGVRDQIERAAVQTFRANRASAQQYQNVSRKALAVVMLLA